MIPALFAALLLPVGPALAQGGGGNPFGPLPPPQPPPAPEPKEPEKPKDPNAIPTSAVFGLAGIALALIGGVFVAIVRETRRPRGRGFLRSLRRGRRPAAGRASAGRAPSPSPAARKGVKAPPPPPRRRSRSKARRARRR